MKGVIRIGGLRYRGFSYTYWNLYVVKEVEKRVKRTIGSTSILKYHPIFFRVSNDNYRIDYLFISCPTLFWERLKKELEWRYVCVDPHFKSNKRGQWRVKTEVDFFKLSDLKDDFPVLIDSRPGENRRAEFKISCYDDECPFYRPYEKFWVDLEEDYKENLEIGTQILKVERAWKRNGGEEKWRKRVAWKLEYGNYKEVKWGK
jgi:hypothetical protein